MNDIADPPEIELLKPVLRLFPQRNYHRILEAALGRKRIDVLCIPRQSSGEFISIELKVRDWRKALWQALVNFQAAEQSYIAIWHKYVGAVQRSEHLLSAHGVGLISVRAGRAEIIRPSKDRVHRIAREHKQFFYEELIRSK